MKRKMIVFLIFIIFLIVIIINFSQLSNRGTKKYKINKTKCNVFYKNFYTKGIVKDIYSSWKTRMDYIKIYYDTIYYNDKNKCKYFDINVEDSFFNLEVNREFTRGLYKINIGDYIYTKKDNFGIFFYSRKLNKEYLLTDTAFLPKKDLE